MGLAEIRVRFGFLWVRSVPVWARRGQKTNLAAIWGTFGLVFFHIALMRGYDTIPLLCGRGHHFFVTPISKIGTGPVLIPRVGTHMERSTLSRTVIDDPIIGYSRFCKISFLFFRPQNRQYRNNLFRSVGRTSRRLPILSSCIPNNSQRRFPSIFFASLRRCSAKLDLTMIRVGPAAG